MPNKTLVRYVISTPQKRTISVFLDLSDLNPNSKTFRMAVQNKIEASLKTKIINLKLIKKFYKR